MNLSPREQVIFDLLKQGPATTVAMAEALGDDKPARRASITQCVKYLAAKVAQEGWCIRRTSAVGRGHVGAYSLERMSHGS